MHWWMFIPIAAVIVISLYALFRWASGAPEIDLDDAREHFREEEEEWRGLRRSGIDAVPDRQR